jgi:hypothetical protein
VDFQARGTLPRSREWRNCTAASASWCGAASCSLDELAGGFPPVTPTSTPTQTQTSDTDTDTDLDTDPDLDLDPDTDPDLDPDPDHDPDLDHDLDLDPDLDTDTDLDLDLDPDLDTDSDLDHDSDIDLGAGGFVAASRQANSASRSPRSPNRSAATRAPVTSETGNGQLIPAPRTVCGATRSTPCGRCA